MVVLSVLNESEVTLATILFLQKIEILFKNKLKVIPNQPIEKRTEFKTENE